MKKHQDWIIYPFRRAISSIANRRGKRESATMDEDHPSLLRKVHRHRGPYLSTADLESLGIKLSGMDIETGRPADSGQQFCNLYLSKKFDTLFEKVSANFQGLDEGCVYSTAFGIGIDLDRCLRELGVFDGWDPLDRIIAYCVRP
jgi:hypothetical protein